MCPLIFITKLTLASVVYRVLTLHATGLMDNWMSTYKPPFKQCPIAINGEKMEGMKSKKSLTIKNLTGAFVVLGIGYCFSVVFLMSEIFFALKKKY